MSINSISRALMSGVVVAVLAAIGLAWAQTRQAVATTQQEESALFVQPVVGGTFDGETLGD